VSAALNSSGLPAPGAGSTYQCWIQDSRRDQVRGASVRCVRLRSDTAPLCPGVACCEPFRAGILPCRKTKHTQTCRRNHGSTRILLGTSQRRGVACDRSPCPLCSLWLHLPVRTPAHCAAAGQPVRLAAQAPRITRLSPGASRYGHCMGLCQNNMVIL
jgi:hypothetical protein